MRVLRATTLALTAVLLAAPAAAEDSVQVARQTEGDLLNPFDNKRSVEEPDFLTIGGGYFDIRDDEGAAMFKGEYRSNFEILFLKPFAGIFGTTDGSVYGYGGLLVDLFLGEHIVLTPSAAVGGYHDGGGKDLGGVPEFRTGAELAYRFDDQSRIGVSFYHISNAGLGSDNPGTEYLSFTYSIPVRNIFGQ